MRQPRTPTRIAILAGAALVLLPALGAAQPFGHRRPGGPGFGPGIGGPGPGFLMGRAFERLDLTPEQRDAIHALFEQGIEERADLRSAAWEQRRILADATRAEGVDEGAIRAAAAAMAEAEASLAIHRARKMEELRALLTPEQRETLRDLQAKMETRREEMREHLHHRHHYPG